MNLDLLFLFCGIAGEAIVLALVLYRRIWRELTVFSAYIAWSLISDIANVWALWRLPAAFGHLDVFESPIDSILQILVVLELAWSVLRPILADRGRVTLLMLGGLIALLGLLIWPIVGKLPQPHLLPYAQFIFHLQEVLSILRMLCFLGLAVFSEILGLGWKDRPIQVAAGLAFFSLVSLAVTVLHLHMLWQEASYSWLDRLTSLSYLGVLLYWIVSFSKSPESKIGRV